MITLQWWIVSLQAEAFGISLRWMGAGCGKGIVGGATCFGKSEIYLRLLIQSKPLQNVAVILLNYLTFLVKKKLHMLV